MPCLSTTGRALMGAGGVQGSLDGTPIPFQTWGGGVWLDAQTAVVTPQAGGVAFWTPGAAPVLRDPRGATVAAGGGRWIAIAVPGGRPTLFGSVGDKPGAGFGDVANDGTVVYKTDYFSDYGLTLYPPTGEPVLIPGGLPTDLQALSGGRAIWRGGGHGHAGARPAAPDAQGVRLVELAGEDWLIYWSETHGLCAQVNGALDGYVLEPRPIAFRPSSQAIDGQLVVAWSVTEGEGPGDLVKVTVDRSRPRVPLAVKPPVQPIVTPPVTPAPTPDPEPIQMPIAPNKLNDLRAIVASHPEIDTRVDGPFAPNRGGITQIAALQFGYPFGRKSRDRSQTNLSDDALCYQLPDQRFEIYDILSGVDGSATWGYAGTFANGENGYFIVPAGSVPPLPNPGTPLPNPGTPPPTPPPPVDLSPLIARLAAVEAAVRALEARPAPVVDVDAVLAGYEVFGKTAVGFGHQHLVKLSITRRK